VGVSQQVTKALAAFARAENVGNNTNGEATNDSYSSPRSVTVGATFRY